MNLILELLQNDTVLHSITQALQSTLLFPELFWGFIISVERKEEASTHIFTESLSVISACKVEMPVQVEVIGREFSYTKNCLLALIRNLDSRIILLCFFYQAFFQACHHLPL